jgi:hypothetical protein
MSRNLHFETAASWEEARALLTFVPLLPAYTTGAVLQSIQVHVRDHKRRDLPIAERSLEAHYGSFVVSEAWKGVDEARRLALEVSYGREPYEIRIAGRDGRVYELGPEPPPDDIDGRPPAVVTWSDGELHFLIASDTLSASALIEVAGSMYQRTT